MNSYIKKNIDRDPEIFVLHTLSRNEKAYFLLRWLYVSLNILTILGAFVVVVLTTIIISKLVFDTWPIWYYYASTSIAALSTFTSSILNLLVVNKKMYKIIHINRKINAELAFYSSSNGEYRTTKKAKKHLLFINVAKIVEYKIAIHESANEF